MLIRKTNAWVERGQAVATEEEKINRYERHGNFNANIATELVSPKRKAGTEDVFG